MSSPSHILRIPRIDIDDESFVLVHVTSDGTSPLDLKLVATEGDHPYVGKGMFNYSEPPSKVFGF